MKEGLKISEIGKAIRYIHSSYPNITNVSLEIYCLKRVFWLAYFQPERYIRPQTWVLQHGLSWVLAEISSKSFAIRLGRASSYSISFYSLSFYYFHYHSIMHLCREDRLEPKDSSFINGFSLPLVFLKSFFFSSVFFSFLSSFWIMLYLYIYCYLDWSN